MTFKTNINTLNLSTMNQSVGVGGRNLPLDVLVVQRLLNGCKEKFSGQKELVVDGLYGENTRKQIEFFQREVMGFQYPDSLISANKNTHKKLVDLLSADYRIKQHTYLYINQKKSINIDLFITLYKKQYPTAGYINSLERLVRAIMADPHITDMRWVAYVLATVKRECGGTWQPIKEYGLGKGRKYDKEVEVIDPCEVKPRKNVYYGRGYVQLTWDYNYKKLGKALGMGDQLYINPDDALKHEIAYKIMSEGMRKGLFFSKARLSQYLSGDHTDYVGARRIINGNDHASEIARDAVAYESLLFAAASKSIYRVINTKRVANYV